MSDGPGAVRVEAARGADAVALAEIARAGLPEPWSETAFAEEIEAGEARAWVVRDPAGAPVAYLMARRVLDEVEILSLAVAAAWRRRGLGRALVEHALAAEGGWSSAHLEVRDDDAGAQAFYAGLGFRPVGRRPRFYRGGIDATTMRRDAAPGRL